MIEIVKPGIDPEAFYYECDRCECIFRFKKADTKHSSFPEYEGMVNCPGCGCVHHFNSHFLTYPIVSYRNVKVKLET